MTISFEAFAPMDSTQATEAGVDFFKVWDASPLSAKDLIDNSIKLLAYPNPSSQNFVIKYELENFSSDSKIMVYNTLGQIVAIENLNGRNGQIEIGNNLEKGIYFAHITNGNSISKSLKLIKQ
jgi:Secretion system C-terminal sorting domain